MPVYFILLGALQCGLAWWLARRIRKDIWNYGCAWGRERPFEHESPTAPDPHTGRAA